MNDNEVLLKRVLRIFRNAVIQLVRERLTAKYAAGAEAQLAALFGKKQQGSEATQWDNMKLNAERARASIEVSTFVADEFELLGVSDFFVVFEKFYDDLTRSPAPQTPIAVLVERKKGLFRCLQQAKVFRDPNAHEVTVSVDNDSLLLCIINCKLVCSELGLDAARASLDELHKEITAASLNKQATVIRISDENVCSSLGARCMELAGAKFEINHFRDIEKRVGLPIFAANVQNYVVVVAAEANSTFSEQEVDDFNELLIACDRQGTLPILLMSQGLTEGYVEQCLNATSQAVFKKVDKLLLVHEYADATASKLSRLLKSGPTIRERPASTPVIAAAQAIHNDKLAPLIFSLMKDPELKTARIVAPFATDMKFGAFGPISIAMIEAKKRGCRVCLVTRPPNPKDADVAAKRQLLKLLHSESIELYVNPQLHSKVYLFERNADRNFWAVGSHNLTNFAHNGTSLETSMIGYRKQEFNEAQTSFERARRDINTLSFDAWATQQMRANNQSQ